MFLTLTVAAALTALGCSDPPIAEEPAPPERPGVPAPATSGAFFADVAVLPPPNSSAAMAPERLVPQQRPGAPTDLAFVDEDTIAVLDEQGTITLIDLADASVRGVFDGVGAPPLEVHGDFLTARSMIVDLRSGTWRIPGGGWGYSHASPRGELLVAQSPMTLRRVAGGEVLAAIEQNVEREPQILWLPDGEHFVFCGRSVEVHAARDGALSARWEASGSFDSSPTCAVRPGGGAIAWIGGNVTKLLHPGTLEVIRELPPEGAGQPDHVTWSNDGSTLVTWREGAGRVAIYDAVRGELVRALVTDMQASSVAVGARGAWVAIGMRGRAMWIDAATGQTRERVLDATQSRSDVRVAFDATGTRLAIADANVVGVVDLFEGPDSELDALALDERPRHMPLHAAIGNDALFVGSDPTFRWGEDGATATGAAWNAITLDDGHVLPTGPGAIDVAQYRGLAAGPGCFVATRRADAAIVVLGSDGRERSTLALDDGETSPCTTGWLCGLPVAVDEDCGRVAIQRGDLLRVFDASSGRMIARRDIGSRVVPGTLAIAGGVIRTARDAGEAGLVLLDVARLRPRFQAPWADDDLATFGPAGAWHAQATDGAIAVAPLATRGPVVTERTEGATRALSSFGDFLVRETDDRIELRDASAALLASIPSPHPRLVIEATAEPPSFTIVDCSGGQLRIVPSGAAARVVGRCTAPHSMVRVGDVVAIEDDGRVWLLRVTDGAVASLEGFARGEDAWVTWLDGGAMSIDGHAEDWRRRTAGHVMSAALEPATVDASGRAAFVPR